MSEFDQFFKDKLEEESQFPNSKKNWSIVSKQLDAFQVGHVQQVSKAIKLWKIAASGALLLSAALGYLYIDQKKENQELRQALTLSKQKESSSPSPASNSPIVQNKDQSTPTEIGETSAVSASALQKHQPAPTTASSLAGQNRVYAAYNTASEHLTIATDNANPQPAAGDLQNTNTNPAVSPTQDALISAPDEPNKQISLQSEASQLAEEAPDKGELLLENLEQKTPQLLKVPEYKLSIANISPISPNELTKTYKPKQHLQVGIEAFSAWAQPKEAGVTPLLGQGISVQKHIWRGISTELSGQWMSYKENTDEFITRFHPHHDQHGGGNPPSMSHELAKVESNPRQQRINLGITYELPVHSRIKPAFQVAHSWIHHPETLIVFTWEEDDPGGPHGGGPPHTEQIVERTQARWSAQNWRFSLGLNYQRRAWTVGLWTDYSRQFTSNDPIFDALFVRAGLRYQI